MSATFRRFFASEKSGGVLLIVCTAISLALANSALGPAYSSVWQFHLGSLTVADWINDGLMAVFFLLIGLELERELYNGELSNFKNALLPILAALGGICVPALIYFALNRNTSTQAGIGIPMATDIAFALGALAILGSRVPASLKIFLAALAVIDDLAAIIVIAVFYTTKVSLVYLFAALGVFALLIIFNRLRWRRLLPFLIGGIAMWFLTLKSGVHATIAGVLLAFTIPFSAKQDDEASPSHRLENFLQKPVAFIILPIFALANTGISLGSDSMRNLTKANSLGILSGLVIGKPLGITLVSFIAVSIGICRLPAEVNWRHIIGAGMLGGIGFTMSIFITNLAFTGNPEMVSSSKLAILLASLTAGTIGILWLRILSREVA